jgi:hypothetical protein
MLEPNGLTLQVYLLDATPVLSGSLPASAHGSSSVELSFSDSFLGQAGTIAPFARCTRPRLPPDQPTSNQLVSSWMINDFNFLTPILARMYPSNSFMDGSAIGSPLPILKIPIAAFRAISQRGKLQPFVPAVPEECTPPVRVLLLARILL